MNAGEAEFADRDRRAAAGFAAAARRAGVRHIIYLGGLGVPPLSAHLASRQETGRILRASGIPVTEFRAAVIVGSGSTSFEPIRHLVERLPMRIRPRWVNTPCQPIAVDDVLRYLAECPAIPESHGRILEIGGRGRPAYYREMMLEYAAARGLKRRAAQRAAAHAAAVLVLVRPRDADPGLDRPAAHRGAPDRGDGARLFCPGALRLRASRVP